jgi:hypothetical protein
MAARSSAATIEATSDKEAIVTTKNDFNRQVWRTALLSAGLLVALIFGIIVLAGGDWVPGTFIVATSLMALATQIPVINKLCNQAPPPRRGGRGKVA